jgi:hypothetical protein
VKAEDIPQELIDILDDRAGRKHSRTGSVITCLAEILTRYDTIKAAAPNDGMHRNPDWCNHCELPLEPFNGGDHDFPVPCYICPKCRAVSHCFCERCEELISVAYS